MDQVINKVEEKTGMDLNHDNHVGNSGNTGHPATGSGESIGVVGKAEQLTHMDLNNDGRVGGGAPQHKH
ncbi:hypothetical protein I4U23_027307 [Adineta vaga]|nr:hypothetical protein I4U23_027307 [Adineta vaga]